MRIEIMNKDKVDKVMNLKEVPEEAVNEFRELGMSLEEVKKQVFSAIGRDGSISLNISIGD